MNKHYNQFADLSVDVRSGRLTPTDAKIIAAKRLKLENSIDADVFRTSAAIGASRARVGSNIMNSHGFGHKTIGAKAHGKHAVGISGAGEGKYYAERLHRVA